MKNVLSLLLTVFVSLTPQLASGQSSAPLTSEFLSLAEFYEHCRPPLRCEKKDLLKKQCNSTWNTFGSKTEGFHCNKMHWPSNNDYGELNKGSESQQSIRSSEA